MSPRAFIALAVVTALAVLGATVATLTQPELRRAASLDTPVFPLVEERVNDAAKLEIVSPEATITLAVEDGRWVVQSMQGYPAKPAAVRETILQLKDLKLAEAKTQRPDRYARLEVEDVTAPEAKSRQVRLTAADGTVLAEAIIGRRRPGALGATDGGTYFRRPGEAQAWLAAGEVSLPQDDRSWLETEIVHLPADNVRAIETLHADGTRFAAERPQGGDFVLDNVPEGRGVAADKTQRLGSALAFLTFADVARADDVAFAAPPNRAMVSSFDGVAVTLEIGEYEGNLWTKVSSRLADDAPSDEAARAAAEKQVAEINDRTRGWAYQLEDFAATRLLPKVEEFLEEESKGSS